MKQFVHLPKLMRGAQVAVISPSAGLPGLFPWVQDLGLERLQDIFELTPKEYPTTRTMDAPLEDRARDVMAAFSDPANKAVFTSIGGSDQIKLLKHLHTEVLQNNPKPFFGFSDNTHLHNFLWNLGVPSYYGGAIMTQLAFENGVPEMTIDSIKHALFDQGEFEIPVSPEYNDIGLDWSDKSSLDKKRAFEPNDGLFWDGERDAEGILWGGCMESLIAQVASEKFLPSSKDMEGVVLYIETAEDIPENWIIEYLLTGFGERGWLDLFQAVLVGRPKAWEFDKPNSPEQKAAYRSEQRKAILRTVRQYNKTIPVVQNLDFGHTNPQIIVPSGNKARIDAQAQKIYFSY
jgi:muramoyltetrapeptide carboxypeptidase LdcA involved in peptidoglycan recycling